MFGWVMNSSAPIAFVVLSKTEDLIYSFSYYNRRRTANVYISPIRENERLKMEG